MVGVLEGVMVDGVPGDPEGLEKEDVEFKSPVVEGEVDAFATILDAELRIARLVTWPPLPGIGPSGTCTSMTVAILALGSNVISMLPKLGAYSSHSHILLDMVQKRRMKDLINACAPSKESASRIVNVSATALRVILTIVLGTHCLTSGKAGRSLTGSHSKIQI